MIEEALLGARLLRPYYARALSALTPVSAPGLGTYAVDPYWRLYYDPEVDWTPKEASAVVCHEVEHLLRRHAGRRGPRDAEPWNVAADAEINDDLADLSLPGDPVLPANLGQAEGLLAEEYYDPAEQTLCRCGSGAGGERLDCELPPDSVPAMDEAQAERVRTATVRDVRAAVAAGTSVPDGVRLWAEAEAESVDVPWPRLLAGVLARCVAHAVRGRADYSWQRFSRRTRPGEPLRPGTIAYTPRCALVLDTSGSTSDDGAAVLGVVRSLVRRSGCEVATTIECDAEVRRKSKGVRVTGSGGGGTDLRKALAVVNDVDLAVVVTDGHTPWPDTAPLVPVAVVLTEADVDVPAWTRAVSVR